MTFNCYCIVVMDKTDGVRAEISSISDMQPQPPKYVDAKGIFIATFYSVLSVNEVEYYFKSNNRSFLLVKMGGENCAYNITKEQLHKHLFGHITQNSDLTMDFDVDTWKDSTEEEEEEEEREAVPTVDEIDKMSIKEAKEWIDILIDRGVANLTKEGKETLTYLSEKTT